VIRNVKHVKIYPLSVYHANLLKIESPYQIAAFVKQVIKMTRQV